MKSTRKGFTQVELVTVSVVLAVVVSVLAPAVYATRAASRQDMCRFNLKHIGLALHNYHEVHQTMPPAWTNHTTDPGLRIRLGWMASLLPYVDQAPLFDSLDWNSQRVDTPEFVDAVQTPLSTFRCPSDSTPPTNPLRGGFGTSNYSGNFGSKPFPRWLEGGASFSWPGEPPTPVSSDGIFWWNSRVRIRDMRDGTANVLWVGETSVSSGASIWLGVRGNQFENDTLSDCSIGNEMNSGLGAFSSRHAGGAHFLMGDGTVRFISEKIESGADGQPGLYQNLSSRADGRIVGEF